MSEAVGESGAKTPSTTSDSDDGSNTAPSIVQVKIERCWADDDPEAREPVKNETEDPLALGPEPIEHFITVEVPLPLSHTATMAIKHEPVPAPGDTIGEEIVRQYTFRAAAMNYEEVKPMTREIGRKAITQRTDMNKHTLTVKEEFRPDSCEHSLQSPDGPCAIEQWPVPAPGDTVGEEIVRRYTLRAATTYEEVKPVSKEIRKKGAQRTDMNHKLTAHEEVRKDSYENSILNQTASCTNKQVPAPGDTVGEEIVRQYTLRAAGTNYEEAKPFLCEICKKTYAQRADLEQHELTVHEGVKPYTCDICRKKVSTRTYLAQHMLMHTGNRPHSCDFCGKQFIHNSSLTIHKRVHTGVKPYSCDICNKAFTQRGHMVQHKLIHTGEKPYSCNVCNKAFTTRSNMNEHKQVHTRAKVYSCDLCDRVFKARTSLTSHKLVHTHSGERRFSCEICGKAFMQLGHKIKHMLIHTGEKRYVCDICKRAFLQRGHLTQHILVHTGKKRFSCDVCNKSYARRTDVVQHKLIVHEGAKPLKPYSCEICKKKFSTRSHLTQHMLIHTGERPHSCDVCGKRFTHHSTLVNHKRVHTGEKPFSCDICNKSFTQRAQTIKHMQNHARK